MNGNRVHFQRLDEKLSPWDQQSSHIPKEFLNSPIPLRSPAKQNISNTRKANPSKSSTLPIHGAKNQSTLYCSAYKWIEPCISGLLRTQQVRQARVVVARRKLSKGLEIKSIRKKIFNSWQNGLNRDIRSNLPEFVTASKIDEITKKSTNSKLQSTRVFFEEKPRHKRRKDPVYHHPRQFVSEIYTISAISRSHQRLQRSKTEQSPSKDWKMLRETFICSNPRFMQWQQQTSKHQLTTISLP